MNQNQFQNWIEDFKIITSPLRRYLRLNSSQAMLFQDRGEFKGQGYETSRYAPEYYALIEYSESVQAEMTTLSKTLGMLPRFQYETWPRLEDATWQDVNLLRPLAD